MIDELTYPPPSLSDGCGREVLDPFQDQIVHDVIGGRDVMRRTCSMVPRWARRNADRRPRARSPAQLIQEWGL